MRRKEGRTTLRGPTDTMSEDVPVTLSSHEDPLLPVSDGWETTCVHRPTPSLMSKTKGEMTELEILVLRRLITRRVEAVLKSHRLRVETGSTS